MRRDIYNVSFIGKSNPNWICPTCDQGLLRIDKNTFNIRWTSKSKALISEGVWGCDDAEYIYSCILMCTNNYCNEEVSHCGVGVLSFNASDGPDYGYVKVFTPKYFEPHLKIIKIPNTCPENVLAPFNESFKIYFSSPNASANYIRIALEEIMNDLGIKREVKKNEKVRRLTLHDRIMLLSECDIDASLRDMIMAVKLLGNDGSHVLNNLTADDILDAYELAEYILEDIYGQKISRLRSMTERINNGRKW